MKHFLTPVDIPYQQLDLQSLKKDVNIIIFAFFSYNPLNTSSMEKSFYRHPSTSSISRDYKPINNRYDTKNNDSEKKDLNKTFDQIYRRYVGDKNRNSTENLDNLKKDVSNKSAEDFQSKNEPTTTKKDGNFSLIYKIFCINLKI